MSPVTEDRALDLLRNGVERAISTLGSGYLRHHSNTALREALATAVPVGESPGTRGAPVASEPDSLSMQNFYRELVRIVYRLLFLFVAEERRVDGELIVACGHLMDCELAEEDLLEVLRCLTSFQDGGKSYPVDWQTIGAEELGSIYESLLELEPRVENDGDTFVLEPAPGHERKATGSYYTPAALVDCLLDSALDLVLERAANEPDPEEAILALTVCDPACGSGRFLLAVARRIARHLATVRAGDDGPSPAEARQALRDVIRHCIYGVDVNPLAVEICKFSLRVEAREAGKPLSFLDDHIQCGNALLGATPALMAGGIPDVAWKPGGGDDKEVAKRLRKRNRDEREERGQSEGDPTTVHESRLIADAWCAAFVWPKQAGELEGAAPTDRTWRSLWEKGAAASPPLRRAVAELVDEHGLFHWHLAFPQVFARGGFDCVVGNPPWGGTIDAATRGYFRTCYAGSRQGTIDTFALFIELSINLSREGGVFGLVLPDVILLKNYPGIRRFLLEHATLHEIAHWGQAFEHASIDVCTLVGTKTSPDTDHIVRCVPRVVEDEPRTSPANPISQATFRGAREHRFNLMLTEELRSLIARARDLGPAVKDLFVLREGVHSGNVRSRLFLTSPTGASCAPLIFGRGEISPMHLAWAGKHIQLDPRAFDRHAGDYYNLGNPELHRTRKLLVRRTGDHVLAAVDSAGVFSSNNFFLCVPRDGVSWPLTLYACAVLNSPFATWFFRAIQPRTGKLFAELKITHLEEIPIPFADDPEVASIGQSIGGWCTEPARIEPELSRFCANLQARIAATDRDLAEASGGPG